MVEVEYYADAAVHCRECGKEVTRHDHRKREWRHLDTCQYETRVVAYVPRTRCPKHGVLTTQVTWAEGSSRFTTMFEALVIDWLKEAPLSAVARRLRMTWDQVSGIMERAVARGMSRRTVELPEALAVDETSFQKRHEYVTVVHDPRSPGKRVLHVADGRGKETLKGFLGGFSVEDRSRVKVVAMDMHEPYIARVYGWQKLLFEWGRRGALRVAAHRCPASMINPSRRRLQCARGDATSAARRGYSHTGAASPGSQPIAPAKHAESSAGGGSSHGQNEGSSSQNMQSTHGAAVVASGGTPVEVAMAPVSRFAVVEVVPHRARTRSTSSFSGNSSRCFLTMKRTRSSVRPGPPAPAPAPGRRYRPRPRRQLRR